MTEPTGPTGPTGREHDEGPHGADRTPGRSTPSRAGMRREYGAGGDLPDLVFDPDSRWFADVPLARIDGPGTFTVVRGQLTDRERDTVTALAWGEPGQLVGVFTNGVGRVEVHPVGARFGDDPRDVHRLEANTVYRGRDLSEIAARLHAIANWLTDRADEGWILRSLSREGEGFTITDAPERVPDEMREVQLDPWGWSGGADVS